MKSRILTFTAITLFAALAICVPLRGQGQTTHFRHYKLIDIGTFGGPASYINAPFALGAPNQINNRGVAVGSASTDTPSALFPTKAICGGGDGIVPFVFHAFAWQNSQLTDLGALGAIPAEECSEAVSINANGVIAGRSGKWTCRSDSAGRRTCSRGHSRSALGKWQDP